MGPLADPGVLVLAGVLLGAALVAGAIVARAFPSPRRPRRDLLTPDEKRLSDARMNELDRARAEALDQTRHIPPGAVGG